MKVLVIPSWYPSKTYPNNGSFFREQAEALRDNGSDVSILVVEIPYRGEKSDYRYFLKNHYVENGIDVYRYVYPFCILHRLPKIHYAFLKLIAAYIYKKEFQRDKSEQYLIHAQSYRIGGFIGVCLKKKFGCKCIITEHTSKILKNELNYVEKRVLKKCVLESDEFVCVSKNLKNSVERMTSSYNKIKVYPNMVNSMFSYSKQEKSRDLFSFVSVGNLIKEKNMALLVEAFCLSFDLNENVTLTIVGKGPERERLLSIIQKYDREKQVILTGELGRRDVVKVLQKSNVMVLISKRETFGISYVEGLLCGNVIIGAHNGGADDIINKSNGIFINDFDVKSVGDAMRRVYNNYNQYKLDEISSKSQELYGEKKFAEFYIDLLK